MKNVNSKKLQEPQSNVKRSNPKQRIRKAIYQRWWVWAFLGLSSLTGGTAWTAWQSLKVAQANLPETDAVLTFVRGGSITIVSSDDYVLQRMGPGSREKLAFEDIPPQLLDAFIASEDKNFYEHEGVDYKAIARALRTNLDSGRIVQGGSTITQQLARLVFLDQSPTIERKVREALIAHKIEDNLSKEKILERYLNLVYLGSGAYGIADAAWIYFSKSVDELNLSEIATIAGLPPAPSRYSPLENLEAAQERRDETLKRMAEEGYITESERQTVASQPLEINPSLPKNFLSFSPYFTSYIMKELPKYISREAFEQGALTVETTLDLGWQRMAEETIQAALADYGRWQNFEQAAITTVDPRTGEIKTMVGGTDFAESQFNRVTQAPRQPGSTFKPFVYATAIASGISPNQSYEDARLVVDGYEPKNYGGRYSGTVTLRDALKRSINIVAVKTLIDIGFEPVIDLANKMGIQAELLPVYSLALGSVEVTLLELTNAYGTFANQGSFVEAHGITRVLDRNDNNRVIYEATSQPQRALDIDSTAIMTSMLQSVVTSGTGRNARLDRPVAGKTGTSESYRDLWFVGYIPQLVTGVWLGNDDNTSTWGQSSTAARIWQDFMVKVVDNYEVENFPELPDLNNRTLSVEAQPVKPGSLKAERSSSSQNVSQRQAPASSPAPAPAAAPTPTPRSTQNEPARTSPRNSPAARVNDMPPSPTPAPAIVEPVVAPTREPSPQPGSEPTVPAVPIPVATPTPSPIPEPVVPIIPTPTPTPIVQPVVPAPAPAPAAAPEPPPPSAPAPPPVPVPTSPPATAPSPAPAPAPAPAPPIAPPTSDEG
ncbi:MAG: PBP1A family penicillin-binding protein [Cyanothece sp. SIO2G6]|nr:PBP1A family penicillin-binding protein [Cyanothece sp. SIO2G6]